MTAYSFKPRFIDPIVAGTKRQTIRAIGRRRHAPIGGALQLYTGMRTKHCRLIGTAVCSGRSGITIRVSVPEIIVEDPSGRTILKRLRLLDVFAQRDGFMDFRDMLAFWRATHGDADFTGVLIRWRDFTVA